MNTAPRFHSIRLNVATRRWEVYAIVPVNSTGDFTTEVVRFCGDKASAAKAARVANRPLNAAQSAVIAAGRANARR